jgi:molecular chaperone DnaK
MIERNTTVPTKKTQVFSTAEDGQSAVTIRVAQGERPMFNDNKALGQFDLVGIPPAQRGIPKIEVTFDIDANGIVHVSAKDLGTKKEQSIKITSTTNLSTEEIEKMKKDAEAHAEEDNKRKDEAEIINHADSAVYSTEKLLKEFEGKVDSKDVESIKADVEALKKLLEDKEHRDVTKIKSKLDALNEAVQKASAKMYEAAGAGAPGAEESGHEHGHGHGHSHDHGHKEESSDSKDDDVVDADFKVKDKDNK